jgi:hypothetical protein
MADTHKLLKWQSHKCVHAARILDIEDDEIVLEGVEGARVNVTAAPNMFSRYRPVVGDYYVVYDDGYASISPRQAFESGYHRF